MSAKISSLPAVLAANIVDTDILPIVSAGITSKIAVSELRLKLGTTPPAGGRTVTSIAQYLLNNAVFNVKDYGAFGDGVTNDTPFIQNAINAAGAQGTIYFPPTTLGYKASGLTQSTNGQVFLGYGAMIIKNANGVIFASTGNNVQIVGLQFRGDAGVPVFTGHNVTFTGTDCAMIDSGSRWASGRAVKATGGHFAIWGSGDVYQTADSTGTGYDIELGISGTATLYHELHGVYTSQATGGILATDVGGVSIVGGQVGKVYFKAGTSPAGVGVNKVIGTRMNGAFTCEISNTVIAGGAFSGVSITFALGTSGCAISSDTVLAAGHTLTNLGNAAQPIVQSIGAAGVQQYKYGDDSSLAIMSVTSNTGYFRPTGLQMPNNKNFYFENNAGNASVGMNESPGGNFSLNNPETSGINSFGTTGPNSKTQFTVDGVVAQKFDNAGTTVGATANGGEWKTAHVSELVTLSTVGTTTDSVANLLPANAIIESVVARVVTGITTATSWALGDATTPARFAPANAVMTAGSTSIGTTHADQTGAAGPRQPAAAKVRITTVGTPGAGTIRVTVFYRTFIAPTS